MGTDHKGFGNLQTVADLFSKLEHDLGRMKASPEDIYTAIDYFVTAEHIIDWMYPDDKDACKRRDIRKNVRLLELVSHLANGSKHFQAIRPRHKSVEEVGESPGGFDPNAIDSRSFSVGSFQFVGLTIKLDDGTYMHALQLAEDVYEYWKKVIKTP